MSLRDFCRGIEFDSDLISEGWLGWISKKSSYTLSLLALIELVWLQNKKEF